MIKFGICNEIFETWELDATFAYAKRVGYDFVELAPFTLAPLVTDISPARRAAIKESAARAGIGISGLHWVLAKTEGLHLTSPETAVRERTSHYLIELVECCADVGGHRIILGSPKQRDVLPGVTHQQAWDFALQTLRPAVKRAEDRDVVICFEPLGPAETNFINTAEEGRRLAAEIASPAISIILDVKAMSTEAKPISQIITESAGRFAYFHANDPNRKGPGFGAVDFHPIAAALKAANYDGIVSVEVFDFEEGPEVIATKSIEYLQKVFTR
ncbi:MAG TPA: sugar phosphate isomerase/epimerase family protein [Chthoniobacteraceae bacterium]|jgi:sugar phosphate isomerase/epimerase